MLRGSRAALPVLLCSGIVGANLGDTDTKEAE